MISIMSLDWVDLHVISKTDLDLIFSHFPNEEIKLRKYALNKIKKIEILRVSHDGMNLKPGKI